MATGDCYSMIFLLLKIHSYVCVNEEVLLTMLGPDTDWCSLGDNAAQFLSSLTHNPNKTWSENISITADLKYVDFHASECCRTKEPLTKVKREDSREGNEDVVSSDVWTWETDLFTLHRRPGSESMECCLRGVLHKHIFMMVRD